MATYYVDATNGDDGALGTSEGTAWKTIGKVNGSAFAAGDSVLFKRGETWTGTRLLVAWSGALGNPITFGAYGSGARPFIDGDDTVNCVQANDRAHLAFEDLDCAGGFDSCFQFTGCSYITVTDCDGRGAGNDNLLFIQGCHDCSVSGGAFYESYGRVSVAGSSGLEIADDCWNMVVDGAKCYDNIGPGIAIHDHDDLGYELPYNLTIQNVECYGNGRYGIRIGNSGAGAMTDRNIVLRDCSTHGNALSGLQIEMDAGASHVNGVDIIRCQFTDSDLYSAYIKAQDCCMRQCVSVGRAFIVDCVASGCYNNTFYYNAATGLYALWIGGTGVTNGVTLRNNILATDNIADRLIGVREGDTTGVSIDYSLYYAPNLSYLRWYWDGTAYSYADWLTNSGQDANSPAPAEPMFVSVPADNFHLQSGSPAIGAGTDVGLFYSGDAPDLGAFERWASRAVTWLHLAGVHEDED